MAVDFDNDLLLITAASGKQGSAILQHLGGKWKRLRLQCISTASRKRLEEAYPTAEVVQGDFSDLSKAKELLRDVTACYLVTPAFDPRETQCGINMIDAAVANARSGGPFKHMVLSSVLSSCLRAMANHDNKRFVEEALTESELAFTIIQPTHVMDLVPVRDLVAAEKPVFPARFNPETRFSFVCTHDLAEAVARILEQRERHFYATYPLVSTPTPLTYVEAMEAVSSIAGKQVRIERLSLEQAAEGYGGRLPESLPEQDRRVLTRGYMRMLVYYSTHGLKGNSSVLEMLLGRKPLSYRQWVEMQLKA